MANATPKSLTIVIPAYNEEEAIGSTVARCLDAREEIEEVAGLDEVEIIVVSDGSTDRTAEIASEFLEVKVIAFEKNRGYGAAIKEGFRQGSGDLVAFLDADGTCDPRTFADLCRAACEQNADVVLGSRMGPGSKMPPIRRLGNRIYAFLLGILCGRRVTDTASGMRVIRRDALSELYPLPDGMHFTPSMSARALLNGLKLVEVPMSYEERIGESKLSVLKDGVRFLRVILEGVLCYRPERLFLMGFTACLVLSMFLAAYPVEFYARNFRLEEWMIYRFVVCFLLGSAGFLLLGASALAHKMAELGPKRADGDTFWPPILASFFQGPVLIGFMGLMALGSFVLIAPGIWEFATTGHVTLHWSRVIVSAFGFLMAFQAGVTGVMLRVLALWRDQRSLAASQARRALGLAKSERHGVSVLS